MSSFAFGCRNFLFELKQSDTRLVLLTQWVLILFLLTLTLVSSSIQNYLQQNLNNLLGSDVVVTRYQKLSANELSQLTNYSSQVSATQLQMITLASRNHYQAAQLKLVDDHYPIQGYLSTGLSPDAEHQNTQRGPEIGTIWLDARLFVALELKMGDKLTLGQTELTVSRIIFHEPDRLLEGHTVAMRAMAHLDSFKTSLVNDSILHRFLVSTTQEQAIKSWLSDKMPDAVFISKKTSRHPLSAFWKRVENFLGLAAIILFFMAAIAIDLVSRRKLKQESYRQAIYLSMGHPLSQGIKIALAKMLSGFVFAAIPAVLMAIILQEVFVQQMQTTFIGLDSQLDFKAITGSLLLAFAMLLSIQLPYLWQLKSASVVSLIREQRQSRFIFARTLWGVTSLSLLAIWYSDNALLTGIMLMVLSVTVVLILSLTFVTLKLLQVLTRSSTGLFSFSIFMMNQRIFSKSTQIMGIGLCVTLLLFTLMLLRDIGQAMEQNSRVNDGNLVISKASEEQINFIKQWSSKYQSPIRQLRPYTRAKLIKINGLDMQRYVDHPSDSMATLQKPIRLSWANQLPKNNQLVDGLWWQLDPQNWQQISVENEIMTDMELKLGDKLTFFIADHFFDFTIVSSHAYKAGQGSITFWFQVPLTAQNHLNIDPFYMGSMEVAENAWKHLSQIWRQHPTVGLMPLKELTKNFDDMLALVTKMVFAISSLLLIMALIVIAASVKGFEQDEQKKNGLLLSLGLDKKHCLRLTLFEWISTSMVSAFGAIAGTWLAGILIYQSQFSLTYTPHYGWLLTTLLVVMALITSIGYLFNRRSLNASVTSLINDR